MIQGDRIELRPLDRNNAAQAISWLTDPEVNAYMLSGHEPIQLEDELHWYDQMEASDTDVAYQIHVASDGRYIGNTGLHHIDRKHRGAELGIMIGSKVDWGQGYGRDVLVTLLRHAFEDLALHRVCLRCHPDNARGLAAYRAVGFTEVGHEREAVFVAGQFQDHLVFDFLEGEFRERYGVPR